jgi:hypothetical protein
MKSLVMLGENSVKHRMVYLRKCYANTDIKVQYTGCNNNNNKNCFVEENKIKFNTEFELLSP